MKKVLVTGSAGFVGKNLVASLRLREDVEITTFDVDDDQSILHDALAEVDFVYHLAGVNRPQHEDEFRSGNIDLTQTIVDTLAQKHKCTPVLLSSTIQSALDNPYGLSKRAAEDAVFSYAKECGAQAFVYRLPNLFGKWCRPNYNSVVATFCHNIANDLPIQINDPSAQLRLGYIDDVVAAFISAMDGQSRFEGAFAVVEPEHHIQLGDLADLLYSFRESRSGLMLPNMGEPLVCKLYSTYLSYLPQDEFSYALKSHVDDRGSFTEFLKTPERGQVSVNVSKPGITKGNHWHHSKNEKFLVVSGEGVIRFRKIGCDEVIEYHVSGDKLEVVDIPPGYTHNISNTGSTDMVTIMWANELFDPDNPDTFFEPV
jgi:UDP-2-acetamido-2,6-beta-L-arabino-hexul-4-ose reductase